jgi:hypothetical protein
VLFCALLLFFSVLAVESVKPKQGGKKTPTDRFAIMPTRLQLDEKQKAQLKPMLEKLKEERNSTLKALDEKETKELSSILKPEQTQQVKRFLKQRQHSNVRIRSSKITQRKPMQTIYPIPPAKLPAK